MYNTLVVYHSHTGNNRYLAQKIAAELNCDIEPIRPRLDIQPILMLFSLFKRSFGIQLSQQKIDQYDEVVVCGPIWAGMLISPLRDAIKKCKKANVIMHFVTCCGSSDEEKNQRFGYEKVIQEAKKIGGKNLITCEALPVSLILSKEDLKNDDQAVMNARLTDANFKGPIEERFLAFIKKLDSTESLIYSS